jgi:hypothetical protein
VTHKKVRDFLSLQRMATVTTIDDSNKPYGAYVYFFLDDQGCMCFASLRDSHKMKNIAVRSDVAVIVAQEVPPQTVQIQGKAEIVTKPVEVVRILAGIAKVANGNPESMNFPALMKFTIQGGAHIACAKVTIDHYKFSDFSGDSFDITEGTGKDLVAAK